MNGHSHLLVTCLYPKTQKAYTYTHEKVGLFEHDIAPPTMR